MKTTCFNPNYQITVDGGEGFKQRTEKIHLLNACKCRLIWNESNDMHSLFANRRKDFYLKS